MNILITSAGRRVSLIKAFNKALIMISLNNKLCITDLNPKYSPAAYFSDKSFIENNGRTSVSYGNCIVTKY